MSNKLIIFDCDGVLVDSEPLSNAVIAEQIFLIPSANRTSSGRFSHFESQMMLAGGGAALFHVNILTVFQEG